MIFGSPWRLKVKIEKIDLAEHYRRSLLAILEYARGPGGGLMAYNIAHAAIDGRLSPWVDYEPS